MVNAGRRRPANWLSETGPLIHLSAAFSGRPWRIGPAWAVLAGALAGGAGLTSGDALLRFAGAVVLADSAWGLLWRLTAGGVSGSVERDSPAAMLPYAQPDAPLARALMRLQRMSAGAWHELPIALALTGGLSLLMGQAALVLSLAVLVVAFVAWLALERDARPALAFALLSVGLPWNLGVTLAHPQLALTGQAVTQLGPSLALAAAFTILQWGVQRAAYTDCSTGRGIWLGEAAVLVALILLRQPWAAAVTAMLSLLPSWWIISARSDVTSLALRASRSAPWWWAAMLVAAMALR